MIETIIKRNGQREPFIAEKPNRWAQWAAELVGDRIDWPSVLLKAIYKSPKEITSRDFQNNLIESTLEGRSWSHYLMAGRLYTSMIYKDIFGSDVPPSIKSVQRALADAGLMRTLKYSDEEYSELEKVINHNRDLECPHFALHHIRYKYSLRNRVTKKEYESQQFVYMRMAMALAEAETDKEVRMVKVKDLYDLFSRKILSAPTPNYVNLGTYLNSYASCCLFTSSDSAGSLAAGDHIAYMQTVASAGIGGNIRTRSIGDPVRGGLIQHQGRLPYLNSVGKATRANLQNGRGGAGNIFFSAFDPEALVISKLSNPRSTEDKKNRDLHYTMMGNAWLAYKAARNEDIFVFNCFNAPDLDRAFYSGDIDNFIDLYEKYENDPGFKKTYVSAKKLIVSSFNEAFETGVSYQANMDEINRHTPYLETIWSSNLCVAPETLLLTDKGHLTISSLEGQTVNVWNGQEFSETTVVKTGENQKLLNVILSDGRKLECTEYHKWYVIDDYHKEPREVRTHQLEVGMRLIKTDNPIIQGDIELDRAYMNGFFTGDGTTLTNGRSKIYLYGEKKKLESCFGEELPWRHYELRSEVEVFGLKEKYFVPNEQYSIKSRLDWLAGWLDADGCVYRNTNNEQLVGNSNNFEFLIRIQNMLQCTGVNSKIVKCYDEKMSWLPKNDGSGDYAFFKTKETYRLLISSHFTQVLLEMGIKLNRLNIEKRSIQRSASQFASVLAVVDNGRVDDTYCVSEPKRHMAVFNGILTGQCVEITQPTIDYPSVKYLYMEEDHGQGEVSTCNLAAIEVSNVKDDAEYEKAMYYAYYMIDRTTDMADYILPHVGYTAKRRRNAAVGIMGLATLMARSGVKYSDQTGLRFAHRVAERHMYFAIKASLRHSKERGLAPWIHKTKWPQGWLPIDTYNRGVDELGKFEYRYDWETLRKQIIENGGIGHSSLVAYMPGEASSKALGGANSLYPIRALTINKSDNNIVIRWAAPEGDTMGHDYEIAWDIPTKRLIDIYSIFQKFTDQSISADLYKKISKDNKIDEEEIMDIYLHGIRRGLKTRYYVNSYTADGDELDAVQRGSSDMSASDLANAGEERGCAGGACSL